MNVTVTMDEEVARWARVRAAERNTSMSRYLGELLREEMARERGYTRAMREFLEASDWPMPDDPASPLPRRKELYDRQGLR